MKRPVLNLLTVLSLLLCVAVVALWVRSYMRWDQLGRAAMWRDGRNWYYRVWHVSAADGGVRLLVSGMLVDNPDVVKLAVERPGEWFGGTRPPGVMHPREPFRRSHWFEWYKVRTPGQRMAPGLNMLHQDNALVRVPLWAVVVAAAVLPALRLVRHLRRHRLRPGLCRSCGYDLRATPGRCPECGTLATAST